MAEKLKGEILRHHSGHQQMPVIAASVACLDRTILRLSAQLFNQKDDITAPEPKNASCEVSCSTLKPLLRLRGRTQS
jgi:hypothetical protein